MRRIALSLLLAAAAAGAADVPYARLREVGDRVKCQCSSGCSYTVGSCNMLGCHFREPVLEDIRAGLEAGEPDEAVLEAVYAKYGSESRVAPRNEGFGRVGWLAPFAALLAGLAVAPWVLRRWHRNARKKPGGNAVPDDVVDRYRSRIEDDLEDLE